MTSISANVDSTPYEVGMFIKEELHIIDIEEVYAERLSSFHVVHGAYEAPADERDGLTPVKSERRELRRLGELELETVTVFEGSDQSDDDKALYSDPIDDPLALPDSDTNKEITALDINETVLKLWEIDGETSPKHRKEAIKNTIEEQHVGANLLGQDNRKRDKSRERLNRRKQIHKLRTDVPVTDLQKHQEMQSTEILVIQEIMLPEERIDKNVLYIVQNKPRPATVSATHSNSTQTFKHDWYTRQKERERKRKQRTKRKLEQIEEKRHEDCKRKKKIIAQKLPKQNSCTRRKERERKRKLRAKQSLEQIEERRQKDREYKKKLRDEGKTKSIGHLSKQEQQQVRKKWKESSRKYRSKNCGFKTTENFVSVNMNSLPSSPDSVMHDPIKQEHLDDNILY